MIITPNDLSKIREKHQNQKIVFCTGTFDLVHVGHVLFFEDCKKLGGILVVALGKDDNIRKYKGENRPIMNEHIRLKMADSLKPVDYVFLDTYDAQKDDPYSLIELFIQRLQPDIYVINEDAFDIPRRKLLAEQYGVQLVILPRYCPKEFDGISTTKLITKIKDLYMSR